MAKHLTEPLKQKIVYAITNWKDPENPEAKITWPVVEKLAKVITGERRTRQALERHPEIKKAYKDRTSGVSPKSKKDQRIERLIEEKTALQKENQKLTERFLRWSYNARTATRAPLSVADLDNPLPNPEEES